MARGWAEISQKSYLYFIHPSPEIIFHNMKNKTAYKATEIFQKEARLLEQEDTNATDHAIKNYNRHVITASSIFISSSIFIFIATVLIIFGILQ